jgi:hypothetical protein
LREGIFVFRKKDSCCQIPVDEEEYLKHYSSADVIEYLVHTNERRKIKEQFLKDKEENESAN